MRVIYETDKEGLKEVNTNLYLVSRLTKDGDIESTFAKGEGVTVEDYLHMIDALADIRSKMLDVLVEYMKDGKQ